jgi:iron complex transport system substrate-binding protein
LLTSLVLVKICDFRGLVPVLAILLIFLGSISASAGTVIDDLGFKVVVKDEIRRVVSLVPTNSEMVCLLDCERLKGGTRYDAFPEELRTRIQRKQIEVVGGGFDANLETIVRIQPDLILTNGPTQQRFAVPLRNLGYSVLSLWPRDMVGLKKSFLLLARLMGQEKRARKLVDDVERRFAAIEARTENKPKKRVYLQMWTEPLITVGKHSFPDWLVGAAGGINIFGDLPFDSGQVSLETLIRRDPEVLIFLAGQETFATTVVNRPGWSSIRGVRDARFCFIDEPDIRRSIGFLDGLKKIQQCLFTELK